MSEQGNDRDGTRLFSGPRHGKRKPGAFSMIGSLLVHSLVLAPVLINGLGPEPEPPTYKVYKVKIKSPPPAELGEPTPAPVAAAPRPAVVEPPKPPEPKPPEPKPPAPKPAPKPEPKQEAVKAPPKTSEPKPPTPAKEDTPSRGANPKPGSPGGDGLDIDLEGEDFPDPAYLQNVIRRINQFWRWTGATNLEAHVAFTIHRDGSVSNLRVVRSSGNTRFNFAALQAVEEAGKRELFGALPKVWPGEVLPVMFKFQPPK